MIKKFKYIVSNVVDKSEGANMPHLGLENVEPLTGKLVGQTQTSLTTVGLVALKDDILFGKLRPYLAKVHLTHDTLSCTGEFLVLRPKPGNHPPFVEYIARSTPWLEWATATSYGSKMPRTSWEQMREFEIWLPTVTAQQTITAFLDRETAKIDALIAKQEQLIATLREDRAATITQAVTKGLNPDVEMKESCVPSLGVIPLKWSVRRLKEITTEPLRYGANAAADEAIPENPRFVRITDITNSGELRGDTFRSLQPSIAKPYLLKEGDLLFARSGATVGKSFLYSHDWGLCCFAGYLIKASIDTSVASPLYIKYLTETANYWHHISSEQIQSTIQNVSAERYSTLPVPLPAIEEQAEIVEFLNTRTDLIDRLVNKSTQMISTLREYRSALITGAVTGKIDVREAV